MTDILLKISGSMQRTPEWVELEKQALMPTVLEKSPADIQLEQVYQTQKTTEPATQVQPKAKFKSRGEPANFEHVVKREVHTHINDVQPVFLVDQCTYTFFSTLFFQPSHSSQPG